MAGRIIANTIVAGYPEPGVTADEIIGLVNRYGLPLGGYTGQPSKTYQSSGLEQLVNSSPSIPPARAFRAIALEAWPAPSNVLISVQATSVLLTLTHPQENVDDSTFAGVDISYGNEPYANPVASAYGTIGQSSISGSNLVGFHSQYECWHADRVPANEEVLVNGVFEIIGTVASINAEAGDYYVTIVLNIMRVLE